MKRSSSSTRSALVSLFADSLTRYCSAMPSLSSVVMAVIAAKQGRGAVLHVVQGTCLAQDLEDIGPDLDDLGLDDAPDGISIFEGTTEWYPGSFESPNDGGSEHVGKFRPLTVEELTAVAAGRAPWE